ncbi:MAG: hypothetical protein MK008_11750 [Bdellovibrionales bacterium]|nr:hypothetical protein [Bdellovibrionales bacterium]
MKILGFLLLIFLLSFKAQAQCNLMPDDYHAKKISKMDVEFEKFNFVQDFIDEVFLEEVQIEYENNVTNELNRAYKKLADTYDSKKRKKLSEIEINHFLQSEFRTHNRLSELETYYSHNKDLHGKLIGNLTYERFMFLPEGEMSFPWLPFVFSLQKGSVAYMCTELNKHNPELNHISILFLELQKFEKPKFWQVFSHLKNTKAVVSSSQFQFRSSATTGTIKDFFSEVPVLNLVTKILDKFAIQIDKPLQELLVNTFSGGIKAITITPRGLFISHNAKVLFINFHLGTYQYTDEEFPWLNLLSLPR